MKHLPVATGVFKRVLPFVLLLPLLAALGGCSLFGIATKGNLNELADQQEQQNQQLQAEVAESEKQMDTRIEGLRFRVHRRGNHAQIGAPKIA